MADLRYTPADSSDTPSAAPDAGGDYDAFIRANRGDGAAPSSAGGSDYDAFVKANRAPPAPPPAPGFMDRAASAVKGLFTPSEGGGLADAVPRDRPDGARSQPRVTPFVGGDKRTGFKSGDVGGGRGFINPGDESPIVDQNRNLTSARQVGKDFAGSIEQTKGLGAGAAAFLGTGSYRQRANSLLDFDRIDQGLQPKETVSGGRPSDFVADYRMANPERRAALRQEMIAGAQRDKEFVVHAVDAVEKYKKAAQKESGKILDFTDIETATGFVNWALRTGAANSTTLAAAMLAGYVGGPVGLGLASSTMAVGDLTSSRAEHASEAFDPKRFNSADRQAEAATERDDRVVGHLAENQGKTAMLAVPYAGLDFVAGPAARAGREVLAGAGRSTLAGVAKQFPKEAGGEFLNEGGQEVLGVASDVASGERDPTLTGADAKRVFNAGMAGVAAAPMGTAANVGREAFQNIREEGALQSAADQGDIASAVELAQRRGELGRRPGDAGAGDAPAGREATVAPPPTEARAQSLARFGELTAAHGLSAKAAAAVKQASERVPADQLPTFLKRAAAAMNRRGLFGRPLDDAALTSLDRPAPAPTAPTAAPQDAPAEAVAADDLLGDAGAPEATVAAQAVEPTVPEQGPQDAQPDLQPAPAVVEPAIDGGSDLPSGSGVPVGRMADDAGRPGALTAGAPAPSLPEAEPVGERDRNADAVSGRLIAHAGRTPGSTEALSLRTNADGTLTPVLGSSELVDFDSGEPIVMPAGTSDTEAKQRIRDAGAVSARINFYPAEKIAAAPKLKAHVNRDGTVRIAGDAAAIAQAVPGIKGINGSRGVTFGRSVADRVVAAVEAFNAEAPAPEANRIESAGANVAAVPEGSAPTQEALPRQQVGKSAQSFVNHNAQVERDTADRLGLTADIESQFALGKNAAQVKLALKDRLASVPITDQTALIIGTRATLGIPSQADEEGKAEFAAWKQARDKRAAPATAPTDLTTGERISGQNAAGASLTGTFTGHTTDGRVKLKQGTNTHYVAPESVQRLDAPTQADAAPIEGEPIDKEWTTFTPESGTKNIPRADMPQIKAEHRGAMVNFLDARGIAHEQVEVPAVDLKPTQAEFSPAKVEKAKGFTGTDRSILISSDGHVLDGHHQWMAKRDTGEPVKAIRLDAPIDKLLPVVREFPSAAQADGATEPQAPAQQPEGAVDKAARQELAKQAARVEKLIEQGRLTPAEILKARGFRVEYDNAAQAARALWKLANSKEAGKPAQSIDPLAAANEPVAKEPATEVSQEPAAEPASTPAEPAEPAETPDAKAASSAQQAEAQAAQPAAPQDSQATPRRTARQIAFDISKADPDGDVAEVRARARKAIIEELGQSAVDDMGQGNMMRSDDLTQAVHDGQYAAVREFAAKMPVPVHESDIPMAMAVQAHAGISHSPEDRGAADQRSYVRAMADAWKRAERAARGDAEALERVKAAMADLVSGYRSRYMAALGAQSRVMSSMITGPARFPVRANNKRSDTAMRRSEEADDFLKKGIARMLKAAKAPTDNSPASELARAQKNLDDREAQQATMKAANAALRKGDDPALALLGFSETQIAQLKKPDFAGRTGFPSYKLTNNNAEIRRLRERVKDAEQRVEAADAGPVESVNNGVRIEEDAQADRLRLFFDGKPDEGVRATLKASGFRWSPTAGAWQRQLTDAARAAAKQVLAKIDGGVTREDDAGNVAMFDLSRIGEQIAYQGYEKADVPRVQAARNLQSLIERHEAGKVSDGYFNLSLKMLADRMSKASATKQANRLMSERERGIDIVREKLIAAKRRGDIDEATAEFALWALGQNPALAEGLGISLRTAKGDNAGAAGNYNPAASIMTLFKGKANEGTAVHEILHHSERMMPGEVQEGIRREWLHALDAEMKAAQKAGNTKRMAALAKLQEAAAGDRAAQRELSDLFGANGALDYDAHYQLVNPSEYWAVNATRIMGERHAADTWQAKARQWLREMAQKVKGLLGLRSDAPILSALDAVLNGDGSRQSKKMLSEGESFGAPVDDSPEAHALKALSANDDWFQIKKSDADTVEGITKDIGQGVTVKRMGKSGLRTDYTFTLPDGKTARMVVREPNPYGPDVYGFTTVEGQNQDMQTERPGANPDDVEPTGDVWIDASLLDTGGGGRFIYAIAANYAHNTGRIFIGDPAGLSDEALFRRPEQMLSSALKFGTTRHLAPHPRQVAGDPALGIPPLKWVYGDDLGNIQRLIDTNLKATENSSVASITFDPTNGQFLDTEGKPITKSAIGLLAERADLGREARAGRSTIARNAVLRSLVRKAGASPRGTDGRPDGLLGNLVRLGSESGEATRGIFYSRGSVDTKPASAERVAKIQSVADANAVAEHSGEDVGWSMPEGTRFDNFAYKFQDKNIDLKRAVAAINDERVGVADRWDAYLQEELFHGRAAKRTQDFVNDELTPLLRDMALKKLSMDEVDQYLHARHAKEANEHIAEINRGADAGQTDIEGNVTKAPLQDGGSGIPTDTARRYLAGEKVEINGQAVQGPDAAQRKRLDAVAARVDAIIAKTRETYVNYGLESRDVVAGWEAMFEHYVPLMREDHDGGMGTGQGFSIRGKEAKHRTGSTAKVVDILANIAMQRERAIVRGEKNRVAVALAGLVKTNPNPDFWSFDKVPTERVLNERTGLVETRQDPMFKSRPNVLVAKIVGKDGQVHERAVVFNERNERAMRMAAAMKNLDAAQMEGLMATSATITRYFSAINTQYNPVFGVVNLVRDVQGAAINLGSTALKDHKGDVLKHTLSALRGTYLDARAARNGEQPASKWAELWDEFQKEGGQTGFRDLYQTSADRGKAIQHALDPHRWMDSALGEIFTAGGALKVPMAVAQDKAGWVFDWLSDYNLSMENAVRLSAYKVGLEQGMSKQRAASLAKNLTVNFNRKGQAGSQAGALYAFFNASMQGTARIAEAAVSMQGGDLKTLRLTSAGKAIVAGGILLGVLQAAMLAWAGFDDDEPPQFVRERNLIIPIGGKKYITIPMPLGWHVLPNIGRIATEYALGGFRTPGERATQMIGVLADAFNPVGNAGLTLQTIMPTPFDPVVAIAENKDWTGKPIARTSYNKATPGTAQARDTASSPARWIAQAINYMSGGTEFVAGAISPTPDQIDYLLGQATGGVGREAGKTEQTVKAAFTGESLPPYKVPLVGRFYGNADGPSSQGSRFYANLDRLNEYEAQIKGLSKAGRRDEAQAFARENPEAGLTGVANGAERVVRALRSRKSALLKSAAPRADVKAVEDKITGVMTRLNEAVAKAREKEPA